MKKHPFNYEERGLTIIYRLGTYSSAETYGLYIESSAKLLSSGGRLFFKKDKAKWYFIFIS